MYYSAPASFTRRYHLRRPIALLVFLRKCASTLILATINMCLDADYLFHHHRDMMGSDPLFWLFFIRPSPK